MIYEDNQAAIALSRNSKVNSRVKHIDIKYHYVREAVENKVIDIKYCSTHDMVGDAFTKGLPKVTFEKFRKLMGINQIDIIT